MKKRFSRLVIPGAGSLRGRYIYVAVLFCLFLLGAALLGQLFVERAAGRYIANTTQRTQVTDAIRALALPVRDVETALQRFILLPEDRQRNIVQRSFTLLDAGIDSISQTDRIERFATLKMHLDKLKRDSARLRAETEKIIAVRLDVEQWFPTMSIMLNKLLPDNVDFYTAATLAMDEAYELEEETGQREVHKLFADVRHAWALMASEFRLYVANRFGIFAGDPAAGMRARATNIALYSESIGRLLKQLSEFDERGIIGFEGSEALIAMRRLHISWLQSYWEAAKILVSEGWRRDLPMLKDRIDPLLARIRQTLYALQKELETAAADDVSRLTETATNLSASLWWIAVIGIITTIGGLLIFQRKVLLPIDQIARALKAEAQGVEGVTVPDMSIAETRNLTEAFNEMRQQVRIRQQRLENILDNAAEGIITVNERGVIETFNTAAEKLFGYTADEAIGQNVSILMTPTARDTHDNYVQRYLMTGEHNIIGKERELQARRKDGTIFPISIKISETTLQGKHLFSALVADISERKAMVQRLRHMAEHDGLTNLYNRTYFQVELERVVGRTRHSRGTCCALLYIDLDNFKYVNDTMGHAAGDTLLIEVAGILNKRVRRGDLIARFGGDEFVLLLYDTDAVTAAKVADAFRKQLATHTHVQGTERVDISCSVGITMIGRETKGGDDALAQADLACHLAKRAGRNQVYMFNPEDEAKMASMSLDMGWSRRIKEAIEHDRFTLVYQPIIETGSRKIVAYEILIRMLDENGEHIMPAGFLPSAERFGLATDIDRWVIARGIRGLAAQRKAQPALCYNINLSAQTLADPTICTLIRDSLTRHGVDPEALTFEITETTAIADMAVAETFLSTIKQMGCRTALDDFGSGFTSFAYLRELPIDLVKIDGRYIKHLADNSVDRAMVKAMNEIVQVMGMHTAAEFVESAKCLTIIEEFGLDFAQGYYIGRPEPLSLDEEAVEVSS